MRKMISKSLRKMKISKRFSWKRVGSLDVDPENGFTDRCPSELPVPGGTEIVAELLRNWKLSKFHAVSKDAHPFHNAVWEATDEHPQFTPVIGHKNVDMRWKRHCAVGTRGFELIRGLHHMSEYDFIAYKGAEIDMHPYGACYHDLGNRISTGVIEFFRDRDVEVIIVGGLATDYCVLQTVLQLLAAGFDVIVNLAACRGIAPDTTAAAIKKMKKAGAIIARDAKEIEEKYISK